MNRLSLLSLLRSYSAGESSGETHFKNDVHYVLKEGRYHLAHPDPQAFVEHLEGAAAGKHVLSVFGYENQDWDGSEMEPGMSRTDSESVASTWGVANRAELLKRMTAGLPGIGDEHMSVEIDDDTDGDQAYAINNDLEYDNDGSWTHNYDHNSDGAVFTRTRTIDADEDDEDSEDSDETEYYDYPNDQWGEHEVKNMLRPQVTVNVKHPSIGSMIRVIQYDEHEGDVVGCQHYWQCDEKGTGLSHLIYQSNFEAYEAAGLRKVVVHANITVGGYAWARHGFDMDGNHGGDIEEYKEAAKDKLTDLHGDYGTGQSVTPLLEPLDEHWDSHAGGLAPHEIPDIAQFIKEQHVLSRHAVTLRAYQEHALAGRTSDSEIGHHVISTLEDSGTLSRLDEADDPEAMIKEAVNEQQEDSHAAAYRHQQGMANHLRTKADHEAAVAHLSQFPTAGDHEALLRAENGNPVGTPESEAAFRGAMTRFGQSQYYFDSAARSNAERRASYLNNNFPDRTPEEDAALNTHMDLAVLNPLIRDANDKHAKAILRADPNSVKKRPDTDEYQGERALTNHERDAAIRAWREENPVVEEEGNVFTTERLEEMHDEIDAADYMHELAAYKIPDDVAEHLIATRGSAPVKLGKEVMMGSDWFGQIPLGSRMSDQQTRAGNMYRAAGLLERTARTHDGNTYTQAGVAAAKEARAAAFRAAEAAEAAPQTPQEAYQSLSGIAPRELGHMRDDQLHGRITGWADAIAQRNGTTHDPETVNLAVQHVMNHRAQEDLAQTALNNTARLVAQQQAAAATYTPLMTEEPGNPWETHLSAHDMRPTLGRNPEAVRTAINALTPHLDIFDQGDIFNHWQRQSVFNPTLTGTPAQVYHAALPHTTPLGSFQDERSVRASLQNNLPGLGDDGDNAVVNGWRAAARDAARGLDGENSAAVMSGRRYINDTFGPHAIRNLATSDSAPNMSGNQEGVTAAWADERVNHILGGGKGENFVYEDAFPDVGQSNRSTSLTQDDLTDAELDAAWARLQAISPMTYSDNSADYFKLQLQRGHGRRLRTAGYR